MTNSKKPNDSRVVRTRCYQDQTDELLDEWFSLPPHERNRRFIDTAGAAGIAGVTRRTIEAWIDVGEIRALCIGRKLHVDLETLHEHIRSEVCAWASGEARPASRAQTRNSR
ncbi:MAG: hypothetical protein ABSC02_01180 [Acidobacteriota bacterium]|jgi:excisionase family DNA binding protein